MPGGREEAEAVGQPVRIKKSAAPIGIHTRVAED